MCQLAMGVFVAGSPALAGPLSAAGTVTVPRTPFALTRRLSRGLRDGNSIVVTRSWRVEFARQSRGIAISGEQVSVSVDAPPNLSSIAKIEQERTTKSMFPILLGPDGMIVAAGASTSKNSLDAAIKAAQDLLERGGVTKDDPVQQTLLLAQLELAGSSLLDEMPGDLFYPSTSPFRDVRQVPLPDGTFGEFEVSWAASAQQGSALIETAQREIITRIGKGERRSSEEWAMKAL